MNEKMKARSKARIDSPLNIPIRSRRHLARKKGHLHSDVELSGKECAGNDDRDGDTNLPPPILYTVLIRCWIIILLRRVLWVLDENTFDRRSDVLAGTEEFHEQVTTGHANLKKGEYKHHHDARPKEPVTRRRTVDDRVIVLERHRVVACVLELKVS
jgi:hypothetical protein